MNTTLINVIIILQIIILCFVFFRIGYDKSDRKWRKEDQITFRSNNENIIRVERFYKKGDILYEVTLFEEDKVNITKLK